LAKLQDYFKNDTLALIGYGSQGHGQGLNARDNGLNVIVGVRKDGESWKQAIEDGWVKKYPPISIKGKTKFFNQRCQERPSSP
jgi:ketol-acid reductoisomerase